MMTKIVAALVAAGAFMPTVPATAGEMHAEEARRFVVENLFSFTCEEKHSDHKASEIFHPPRTISF